MHWIMDRDQRVDHCLSALLALQCLTIFVAIPLAEHGAFGRTLLDICHLAFAILCVTVLTRHRLLQLVTLSCLALLTAWPLLAHLVSASLRLDTIQQHEAFALVAFVFNGAVTGVVAHHVFAAGRRVTAHHIRGAVLLYLNISALFAIAYGAIALHAPGAFTGVALDHRSANGLSAVFTYFSLTTLTTTGFGDLVPTEPLTRSLTNLEAVIGQLFPATLLARLVALHMVHEDR